MEIKNKEASLPRAGSGSLNSRTPTLQVRPMVSIRNRRNIIMSPLDEPLQSVIIRSGNQHSDETTLKCCDQRLPGRQEKESDVEEEQHYFKRWIFCHYSPSVKLTQFDFYKRGRRTQEEISRERIIQIGPLLNEFKQMLASLSESLNKEDDPELLKAVNYALKEYPCLLHCLKDGSLRLMSVFANIRNYNLDPITYLCDVFRRIGKTAKEDLETLLAHLWTPQAVLNL